MCNIISYYQLTKINEMIEDLNRGQARTPEELAKLAKQRVLSDAKLVEEGADVTPEGAIVNVDQEEAQVYYTKEEMQEELDERARQEAREKVFEENILDQKPGYWRTVAETINLGEGFGQIDTPPYEEPISAITLRQGDEINVQREHDSEKGMRSIKVVTPEPKPKKTRYYHIASKNLEGIKVKLQGLD